MRNVSPIKVNEFAISSGSPANETNSFIELYNAGDSVVDLGRYSLGSGGASWAAIPPG